MLQLVKSIAKRAVTLSLNQRSVTRLLRNGLRDRCAVFMLHRFDCPDRGVSGHDPQVLHRTLGGIRAQGIEVLGLRGLFMRFHEGASLDGAVCFTIDDGYADHAEVAGPVFAEFDCPVTTFVATGFLDGLLWYWWDRIEYVVESTARAQATLETGLGSIRLISATAGDRRRAINQVIEHCKALPPRERDGS